MTEDLEFGVQDYNLSSGGVVKRIEAEYETAVEDGEVRINYQGEEEKSIGNNEAVYSVDNAGLGSPEEHKVPAPLAEAGMDDDPMDAVERVADSVLNSYAETDEGEQWAVSGL